MPSNKNPITVVLPGPGRLPASTVSASAFIFPGGGGGGGSMAALTAHITDPVDAHMAGAIGIPPVYPLTGEPLLSSNVPPGVIDGESVLDFIAQFKDLLPARPPYLGYAGTNTGVPDWGNIDSMLKGGYNDGANTEFTKYIVDSNAITDFDLTGILYPSDRGVLALYSTPDVDFTNPFSSAVLEAALYLGTTLPVPPIPVPVGIPTAGFDESLRTSGQPNYVASLAGLDKISLTYRLPYLTSYAPGVPYTPYATNFYSFQLGTYQVNQSVVAGGNQNWFLVHWRSTFATSATAIDPSLTALNLASLSAANCYSAVPSSAADFDDETSEVFTLNRHKVFGDAQFGVFIPSVAGLTTALSGSLHKLSGVDFYDKTTGVSFNYSLDGQDQFENSFQTGNSAPVPATFASASFPLSLNMSDFGDSTAYNYQFSDLTDGVLPYSVANPPGPGGIGQRIDPAFVVTSTPYTVNSFTAPYSRFRGTVRGIALPGQAAAFDDPSKNYLFNSWDATGNAGTEGGYDMEVTEKFVDESYRYDNTHAPLASDPIKPVGAGVAYDSTVVLTGADDNLQVIGSRIVYPKIDFSAGGYDPAGPDYSIIPTGDAANYLRRYTRVFNTGIARNTGKLRIRGLVAADFQVNAAYNGVETTGHITGGAIIQVKVPGVTGWLDVGRSLGDPGIATSDFYGCSTAVTVSGSDVIVSFQTTSFTVNNGSGDYPLFVRVSFLNNAAGLALSLDELEWQVP